MRLPAFLRLSLLWKILLSTSVAITLIFALTGWIVVKDATQTTAQSIEDEVNTSLKAYQSIWTSRAQLLSKISLILSTMSDVRAAFSTGDQATIRDTAGELWSRISDSSAIFLVTDPHGRVITSLGGQPDAELPPEFAIVQKAADQFPRQASGFIVLGQRLYHITITPVYIQATRGTVLLNALVAGYDVNGLVARQLKDSTGGSEFIFRAGGRVIASTLRADSTERVVADLAERTTAIGASDGATGYAQLISPLQDIEGRPVGELVVLRSFHAAQQRVAELRRGIMLMWLIAMGAGLAITYVLARRIVGPVRELDRAAAEVARQNYDYQVPVRSADELGRLATTFNAMCASIRKGREDLIRNERIATIGRLSTSIVHDLRNPLAAIYGGAEMLVDSELPAPQARRLVMNIYRASRRIQELLQELLVVSRGKTGIAEACSLRSVAAEACQSLAPAAAANGVAVALDVPEDLELALEPSRIERVFVNLIANAIEAMPDGGTVRVSAQVHHDGVVAEVRDTGPGIAPEVRDRLFQPFVTSGKKSGLGLGLALARQTVLDHGGDMWVASASGQGACFQFRLPLRGASI